MEFTDTPWIDNGANAVDKPTRKHIMFFDESKELLLLTEAILSREGYEICLDTYSSDEYARIEAVMPDLVILDCDALSEPKAWELMEALKMSDTTVAIPTILCITYRKLLDEMRAHLSTKQVAILCKPYDINDLLLTIKQTFKLATVVQEPNIITA